MSVISRRVLLSGASGVFTVTSGCMSRLRGDDSASPHWVKLYLSDRDETHNVTVTITNRDGDILLETDSRLSDSNEASEVATFPASKDPETVVIAVDGTRFERDWPGFEQPELPCDGANEAGIEIRVENGLDGAPDIQILADCQSVQ